MFTVALLSLSLTASTPNYLNAMFETNRDRQTTIINTRAGMTEVNPILGRHPRSWRTNLYFSSFLLLPITLKDLPDWAQMSVYDSLAFTEQLNANRNEDLLRGSDRFGSGSIRALGLKFTIRF